MNPRIKELAKQAGYGQTDDPYVRQAFNVNMFAESLITECANLIYGRDENGNCKDGDTILEHFGIKGWEWK